MKKNIHQAKRNCPVCDHTKVEYLHTQNFELPSGHPIRKGYEIVCCVNCGFIYADVDTNQNELDQYYSKLSKYEDSKISTGSGISLIDKLRFKKITEIIRRIDTRLDMKIIDIGCANGGLLKELKEFGYINVSGVDPSGNCVETTKRYVNCDAYIGSLTNLPENIGKFDCVILSHVLEHIYDLKILAGGLDSLLLPEGMVFIEVPDARHYADAVISPFQEFNTEHINHFSALSLKNLFSRSGFTPILEDDHLILVGDGSNYPVVSRVFRKTFVTGQVAYDPELKEGILEYIKRSQGLLEIIDRKIQGIIHDNPQIIIWGTGQLTMKLLAETSLRNADILFFVDGNQINQGKYLFGKVIRSPDFLRDYPDQPILISTLLHQNNIIERLHEMGYKNKIVTLV